MKNLKRIYEENYHGSLTYKQYRDICNKFNKEVMKMLIEEKESVLLGHFLGSISIIESPIKFSRGSVNGNIKGFIDWKASNEKKARLIEEGKIPLENYKDEKGKITGNNGGHEWIIYKIVDSIAKFHWRRHRRIIDGKQHHPFHKTTEYKFVPSRNNIRTMSKYREENNILYK